MRTHPDRTYSWFRTWVVAFGTEMWEGVRCEKVWEDMKRENKPLASKTFWKLSKSTSWSLESSLCNSLLKKLHFYHFWASWRELPFCGLPKITNGSETYVLDYILEERGLKPRFRTTFWREKGSEVKIYKDFNRKRAQKWRLLERS